MLGLGNTMTIDNNAAFSMTSVPNCEVWYDASTLIDADDSQIAGWRNHLRNADYDLTAASGKRPVIKAAGGAGMAKRSLLFDGSDDHFTSASEFVTNDAHVLSVVFRLTGDLTDGTADAIISGDTLGLNRLHVYSENALLIRYNGTGSGNAGITLNHNNTDNSTVNYQLTNGVEVLIIRKDTSNNVYVYNKNADFISYFPADTKTDIGFGFGTIGIQLASTAPTAGYIGEFAIHNGDPGETACKDIAKYLYDKWN